MHHHPFFLLLPNLGSSAISGVIIVLAYAAILIGINAFISLRSPHADPMLGKKNMPWWLIAASIVGTSISNIAILSGAGQGFALDFNNQIGEALGTLLALVVGVFFFVTFLRKTRNASIYTLLADRFGHWASIYAAVNFIIFSTVRTGIIACLVAQSIHFICGVDVVTMMFVTGLLVIFYTYMSGIEGVVWTDLFQVTVFISMGLLSLWFMSNLFEAQGVAMGQSLKAIPQIESPGAYLKAEYGSILMAGIFFFFQSIGYMASDQGLAQRYLLARSDQQAARGAWIGGTIAAGCLILFFTIGLCLYAFYHHSVEQLSTDIELNNLFAVFMGEHFSNPMKGLAVAGILAAAMSTIDTGINSSATVFVCNLYEPFVQDKNGQKTAFKMQIVRAASIGFGLIGMVIGYAIYIHGGEVLSIIWHFSSITFPGVFGLFLILRLMPRVGAKAAGYGLAIGSLLACWMVLTADLVHPLAFPLHYMAALPIATAVIVLVSWGLSYVLKLDRSFTFNPDQDNSRDVARSMPQNIFIDSLKPKPFYRLWAGIVSMSLILITFFKQPFHLGSEDIVFLLGGATLLGLVAIIPWKRHFYRNPWHLLGFLTLLGLAMPGLATVLVLVHPHAILMCWLFLGLVAALGTIVGWTLMSLTTVLAMIIGILVASWVYPVIGIPDAWAFVIMGTLAIFLHYAWVGAKELIATQKGLAQLHPTLDKSSHQLMDASMSIVQAKRAMNFQDIDRLVKTSSDLKLIVSALSDALDDPNYAKMMELSVQETLMHVLKRFTPKYQEVIEIIGDDFQVIGNRDAFESIVFHLLDHHLTYIIEGKAHKVICTLNPDARTMALMNYGAALSEADRQPLMDLTYSLKDSTSATLSLVYAQHMLQTMQADLKVQVNATVLFQIIFPAFIPQPKEARMYYLDDE